jgi:hypothetical protein
MIDENKFHNFTIGITTFSKRFDLVKKLVSQIRGYSNCDIILTINGEHNQDLGEDYRKNIINLCIEYVNVYPIFYTEMRSLSKLWNMMAIHSKTDWILILNDDLEIVQDELWEKIFYHVNIDKPELYIINRSFSHFFVHKKLLDDIGYFDERLLGFGTEDGDFMWRYERKYNKQIPDLSIHGIVNLKNDMSHDNIRKYSKYSSFNNEFCFMVDNSKYKHDPNGVAGPFSYPISLRLENEKQYPYEIFFMENKNNL